VLDVFHSSCSAAEFKQTEVQLLKETHELYSVNLEYITLVIQEEI